MCRYTSQATQKAISNAKVKVNVTRSLTLVSFESVCMPNIKSQSSMVQKLNMLYTVNVKVDNRQIREHKKIYVNYCQMLKYELS